jgi:hypothetical protein
VVSCGLLCSTVLSCSLLFSPALSTGYPTIELK